MLKGYCSKRQHYINDSKVVRWCRKVNCCWLKFRIINLRKEVNRYGNSNPHKRDVFGRNSKV